MNIASTVWEHAHPRLNYTFQMSVSACWSSVRWDERVIRPGVSYVSSLQLRIGGSVRILSQPGIWTT